MIAPEMPSRNSGQHDISTRIVPVQKAFSLLTRRSEDQPIPVFGLGAGEPDPVLAEWFLRRFSLLDSLYMVPSARLVGRTIRHNMRLWLAERRGRPAAAPAPDTVG